MSENKPKKLCGANPRPTNPSLSSSASSLASSVASTPRRGCCQQPKPGLPPEATPRANGSMSSVRLLSEELARQKISDAVKEPGIPFFGPGKWTWDRKSSSGSVLSDSSRKSSLDGFGRKYSDASLHFDWSEGRRRSSDASVLNEDTDSFIIGDRVWVGGTKPGQIAYLGETQFAPGEWAGVVLDEPIGKNDGSVANIRYFQCEPRKGVFSRLTRLTRYPLSTDTFPTKSPSPTSPKPPPIVSSPRSSVSEAPPKKMSIAKPASPDSALHPNIQIGDRVIVMSAQGSKAGVLRFKGATDFAPGEWAGVELDDPLGKNDGSVAGTRYFECRPNFGLFAPLHKVSKSPANRRISHQNNCQIHSRGSRESLLSNLSSSASNKSSTPKKISTVRVPLNPVAEKNALQEALKERDVHIDQLLKEREIERNEFSKTAKEIVLLKHNLEAALNEIESLKHANTKLTEELILERKHSEDLQFRIDEESCMIKDNEVNQGEHQLNKEERSFPYDEKEQMLEREKLELKEQVVFLTHENEVLSSELQETKEKIKNLNDLEEKLRVEEIKNTSEIKKLTEETNEVKLANTQLEKTLKEYELEKENLVKQLKQLEENAVKLAADLLKKTDEADELMRKIKLMEEEVKSDKEKFSIKVKDAEDKLMLMQNENESLKEALKNLQHSGSKSQQEFVEMQNLHLQAKRDLEKAELEYKNALALIENEKKVGQEMKAQFDEMTREKDHIQKCFDEKLIENEKFSSEIQLLTNEKDGLSMNNKTLEANIDAKNKELANKSEEINKLSQTIKNTEETLETLKVSYAKCEETIQSQEETIRKLKEEINNNVSQYGEELKVQGAELEQATLQSKELKENLNLAVKQIELLKQENANLQLSVHEGREKVVSLEESLKENSEKYASEISKNTKELKSVEDQLKEIQSNYEKSLRNLEDKDNQLTTKISEIENLKLILKSGESEKDELKNQLKEIVNSNNDLSTEISKIQEISKEEQIKYKENVEKMADDLKSMQNKLQEAEVSIRNISEQRDRAENEIKEYISASGDNNKQISQLQIALNERGKEIDTLRNDLSEVKSSKEQTLSELNDLRNNLKLEATRYKDLEDKYEKELLTSKQVINSFETTLNDKEDQLKQLMKDLELYKVERETKKKHLDDLEGNNEKLLTDFKAAQNKIQEMEIINGNLQEEVQKTAAITEEKLSSLKNKLDAAEAENAILKENNSKMDELLKQLEEEKWENGKTRIEIDDLRSKIDILFSEKSNLVENLSSSETALSQLKKIENDLKNKVSEMEEELKIAQQKVIDVSKSLTALENTNKNLQDSNNNFEKVICEEKNKNEALRSELDSFTKDHNKRLELMVEEKEKLRKLLKEIQDEKENFAEMNEKKKLEIDGLKTEIARKESDFENLKETLKQRENELLNKMKLNEDDSVKTEKSFQELKIYANNKETELSELRKVHESLVDNLKVIQLEKESNEEKSKHLTKELESVLNLKSTIEKSLDDYKNKLDTTSEENRQLKSESKEFHALLEKTKFELEETKTMLKQEVTKNGDMEDELYETRKELEKLSKSSRENELEEKCKRLESNLVYLEGAVSNLKIERDGLEKMLKSSKLALEEKEADLSRMKNEQFNGSQQKDNVEDRVQIDFLNSVIVDMQMKNQALKTRIEALELGITTEELEEYRLDMAAGRTVAPRLFCDICDIFDLHETEDCPKQATVDPDEPPPPSMKKEKKVPEPRPYCENCEVFGHNTNDCDEAETF